MAKKFALDDAADFDANLNAFSGALTAIDAELAAALAQNVKGKLERGATLDALLAAIAKPAAKS